MCILSADLFMSSDRETHAKLYVVWILPSHSSLRLLNDIYSQTHLYNVFLHYYGALPGFHEFVFPHFDPLLKCHKEAPYTVKDPQTIKLPRGWPRACHLRF